MMPGTCISYILNHFKFSLNHYIIRILNRYTQITRSYNNGINAFDTQNFICMFHAALCLDLSNAQDPAFRLPHIFRMASAGAIMCIGSAGITADAKRRVFAPGDQLLCLLDSLDHRDHHTVGSAVQCLAHIPPCQLCHSYDRRNSFCIPHQDQFFQAMIWNRPVFTVIEQKIHAALLRNDAKGRMIHDFDQHSLQHLLFHLLLQVHFIHLRS